MEKMDEKKKLPIGEEFFQNIRQQGFYYVDKTGFIRELLLSRGSVNLFTRPRRFGKSLNQDMLKAFFEIGAKPELFEGLEISKEKELCEQYLGKYPVIALSFKDVEGEDFQTAYDMLGVQLSEEAEHFSFLLESDRLTESEKIKLQKVMDSEFEKTAVLTSGLKLLTRIVQRHFLKPAIILIDEYDVPLDKAYQNGYYLQMITLIRSMLSQALKTNPSLYFAVLTGCLRISRESIFTGLNNLKVRSITDVDYAEYFGFTDEEVRTMLEYYGLEDRMPDVKEWYDGYHFGGVDVYCPWDVINQCEKMRVKKDASMELYWANSSQNSIVRNILENANATTKYEMEALISGESIEKELIPELTYTDFDSEQEDVRQTYLWSVLFATGYLTDARPPKNGIHSLVIPNREVRAIYEKQILSWFKMQSQKNAERWKNFCRAFREGNGEAVQENLNGMMAESISIRDTYVKKEMKENFYHGMLLGLLQAEGSWIVKSNTEAGIGYTDIKLIMPAEKIGCIIEMKYAENGAFDAACREAIKQIEEEGYLEGLKQEAVENVYEFGIACYRKTCRVVVRQKIPIVVNNGSTNLPEKQTLLLLDAFKKKVTGYEWTAHVLNINAGKNADLKEHCPTLQEYSQFIESIKKHRKDGLTIEEAITQSIDSCIERGILEEYLRKHKAEVKGMVLTEFDQKLYEETLYAEGREDGRREGIQKGKEEGRFISMEQLVSKAHLSQEEAMKLLNFSSEEKEAYKQWK